MTSPAATGSLLGSPTSSRSRPGVGDHSGLGTSAPSGPPGDSLPSGRSQPPGSPPSTQMVSIPHIPTFCTPERPRPPPGASEASQLDLHARGLTDSDQELLESPRAVPSSLPAPGQASATVSAPPRQPLNQWSLQTWPLSRPVWTGSRPGSPRRHLPGLPLQFPDLPVLRQVLLAGGAPRSPTALCLSTRLAPAPVAGLLLHLPDSPVPGLVLRAGGALRSLTAL